MDTQIQHRLIEASDSSWLEFIQSCNNANIFHHPVWLEMMSECYGYRPAIVAILDEYGNIQAGLPFLKVQSPFTGRRWVSIPFSDYCKPLYRDDSALDALTRQLVHLYQENKIDKLEVRWALPDNTNIHTTADFVLHTLRLNPDPDQVSRKFKRTHLQNIHQAEERGVEVELGDQLEHMKVFFKLQLETRKRHCVPCQPWRYFELLWRRVVKSGMGFVLLAKKDGEYIAGMVYLGWNKTLIAKYAASSQDSFNLRPNNLLFWEGIRFGCLNGYEVFDMGRSEIENAGLRKFKSRWGAVEEPLNYSIIADKPDKTANSRLESMLHSVIERSPLWVCRLSGELLYRHFG
ncbi:MAG: GNAT family N-acetyltransferase [Anaerolineales bacterium]|nr:GNAT family N-acetyltransferase [Anaerolineales bacterium]